jgi:hypothetical protein
MAKKKKNDFSRLTCEKAKKFINDEQTAKIWYNAAGLHEIAADEKDHEKIFKDFIEKNGCQ